MQMDTESLDIIRERFISLNRQRLERCQDNMQAKQKDFLTVLPLLFHINHASLPGYVGPDTPFGVSAYAYDDAVTALARRLWRGFDINNRAQWTYAIEAIFLMGSVGTIAFSRKSDFDIWLCHKPDLPPGQIEALQKKATGIEKWAEELGLEAHFFLMDAEKFRTGTLGVVSTESSGSAQHRLLLDEFYRTSIWMAGKHPFWWFISPEQEGEYEQVKKMVEEKSLLDQDECVDFGGLPNIPADEFLGAAVWQLNKAIDSPYKSLLKITLMEAYASEYPDGQTLSTKFKQKIYDGVSDLDEVDPYIMLLHFLEEYVRKDSEKTRIELLHISFYFKLGISLSLDSTKSKTDWRQTLLRTITESWGWNEHVYQRLDSFKDWKIDDVQIARKSLVDNLTRSYMFLSDFARAQKERALIKQRDLTILGRKLYAVYDRKPGKIEIVSHGFKNNINEDVVTFLLAKGKSGDKWLLYRGKVTGSDFKNFKPIKVTESLVELMVWAYFNRVVGTDTRKMLYAPGSDMKSADLNTLLEDATKLCNKPESFYPDNDDLKASSVVRGTRIYINVGRIPRMVGGKIEKEIVSGSMDVLKYGTDEDCLVSSVELVYTTSWNEIYVMQYAGMQGLFSFVCDLLNFSLDKTGKNSKHILAVPEFCSISSHFGHVINRRVESMLQSMHSFFFDSDEEESRGFVVEAVRSLFIVERKANKFVAQRFASLPHLIAYLGMPLKRFRAIEFDKLALTSSLLPTISRLNQMGQVQLFYEKQKKGISVWILDEHGALFMQNHASEDVLELLHHYYQFFANTIKATRFAEMDETLTEKTFLSKEDALLGFYSVKKEGLNFIVKDVESVNLRHARIPYELSAFGESRNKKTVFRFIYDGVEYSSASLGGEVFTKVRDAVVSRQGVVITRMQLSRELLGLKSDQQPSMLHMLSYKRRIEDKLNRRRS